MSDNVNTREALADAQVKLADALAGGSVPDGFDASRVELSASMLIDKRRRAVAHILPRVARSLGGKFKIAFDAYAHASPHPPDGQALRDAADFLQTIPTAMLDDGARLEVLVFRLRQMRHFAAMWLADRRGLLVGARLPLIGLRVVRLPLPQVGPRRGQTMEPQMNADEHR